MRKASSTVNDILSCLESHHGVQECSWPADPYLFLIWWHCGYPASDEGCARGWKSLNSHVGVGIEELLHSPVPALAEALRPGGMVPELRAMRLKEIASRVKDRFAGDLLSALHGSLAEVRKTLKSFPNIADPGADRILLFAGLAPIAAVPSNCPHVLVRILHGRERESYAVTYREAQEALTAGVSETFDARRRAYLLLKHHGQELCKRNKPMCNVCPVSGSCAYFAGHHRGRSARA